MTASCPWRCGSRLDRLTRGSAAPPPTRTPHAARTRGLTEWEVKVGRRTMPVSRAKAELGRDWGLSAQFTGREVITEKGRAALAAGRLAD